jgi:quinol monooxygenase YgiN
MSKHVFVISEWLPKAGKEQELWVHFQKLVAETRKELGCVRAHATRQITHPGAPTKSKYPIVLLQEYVDSKAFDQHCASEYVAKAFSELLENKETAIIEEWQCRLFGEG